MQICNGMITFIYMYVLITVSEVALMCMHQVPTKYSDPHLSYTHPEVISYTVQCSYMEGLSWEPTLIIFDLKLLVSNTQPGCLGSGSLAVSGPFSCLLPADKEAKSNPL